MAEAAKEATLREGHRALHYYGGPGTRDIREWIARRLRRVGIEVPAERISITAGAAQAIEVAARLLTNVGDEVWVEHPTFFGAIRRFQLAGAELRAFDLDEDGLDVRQVAEELKRRRASREPLPKLIYVMPNYHNPAGVTMTVERRRRLAELAAEYGFYIIEDDAYRELNYTGEVLPSIWSFAPEQVIHVGTFSKIIGPGVRLGWAVASPELQGYMRQFMHGSETNPFMQEIVASLLGRLEFDGYLERLISRYKENLDVMTHALTELFGNEIAFAPPKGGFFLSVRFGSGVDVKRLAAEAEAEGVSVVDGSAFHLDGDGRRMIRLCFTYCTPENIRIGIERLHRAYVRLK